MMNPKAALQNNFDVTQVGHNEVAALRHCGNKKGWSQPAFR